MFPEILILTLSTRFVDDFANKWWMCCDKVQNTAHCFVFENINAAFGDGLLYL